MSTLLNAVVKRYAHTEKLISGELREPGLQLNWLDVEPIYRAFAPMARQQAYDVSELAIATLLQAKAYDKARQWLSAEVAVSFQPLVADRLGDIEMQQGQLDKAREQYLKAWNGMDARADYRQIVAVKLATLGVDPKATGAAK